MCWPAQASACGLALLRYRSLFFFAVGAGVLLPTRVLQNATRARVCVVSKVALVVVTCICQRRPQTVLQKGKKGTESALRLVGTMKGHIYHVLFKPELRESSSVAWSNCTA